jgi:hypothetical protein
VKPTARWRNVFKEQLQDEVLLYDKTNNKAHCLNASVAAVWEHADGLRSIDDIADIVSNELQIPRDRSVILLALQELDAAGLLESSGVEHKLPSRREATRRLALAGGSAAALPFITSVIAPTPAMASSPAHNYTLNEVQQNLNTIQNDIAKDFSDYLRNPTAQSDFNAGLKSFDQGVLDSALGKTTSAQVDFQSAENDFAGVLRALGLPPL